MVAPASASHLLNPSLLSQTHLLSSCLDSPNALINLNSSFISFKSNSRKEGNTSFRLQCLSMSTNVSDENAVKSSNRTSKRGTILIGSGSAVPKCVVSNSDLANVIETNDEWISTRTGIRNRRVLTGDETITDLAISASQKALEMAMVDPSAIDLIILCTSTPDDIFGGACQVQAALGCKNAVAFDLTAACSGFVLGLITASRFIQGGGFKNVLVIGADALSRYVDWTDRGTCILFGDASGAVVVRASEDGEEDGVLGFEMCSDGVGQKHLHSIISPDDNNVDSNNNDDNNDINNKNKEKDDLKINDLFIPSKAKTNYIYMNGKEVFRFAVKAVPQVVEKALKEAEITIENVDWLLLHQANQRILDAVADKIKIPSDRVISNLSNYGNTSAASIPLALDESVRSGKVKDGNVLAIAGFGAGLSWASAIVRWK